MFKPKPGQTFTNGQILEMAEKALTQTIARPRLGAWAVMQLLRAGAGLPVEGMDDSTLVKEEEPDVTPVTPPVTPKPTAPPAAPQPAANPENTDDSAGV